MRVSRAQAEENRRAVVNAAGKLFREQGFDGVGLSALMKSAGLTHGGFYKQFASKEALIAEACGQMIAESAEKWQNLRTSGGEDPLAALVKQYLCTDHRDRPGEGCAIAALGTDVARHGAETARCFESGIRAQLAAIDEAIALSPPRNTAHNAIAVFSTMVGALLLARTVEDNTLSQHILNEAARSLLEPGER
jgi:TetR/AcrR family transcriptional repressor of nem operon